MATPDSFFIPCWWCGGMHAVDSATRRAHIKNIEDTLRGRSRRRRPWARFERVLGADEALGYMEEGMKQMDRKVRELRSESMGGSIR